MPPIRDLQRHVAWYSLGPTTLRRMVKEGQLRLIRDVLSNSDLAAFRQGVFQQILDSWTEGLVRTLSIPWGPVRKSLNLLLRDTTYNVWLREAYELSSIEADLEVPLESITMLNIRNHGYSILEKVSVKNLDSRLSASYQEAAMLFGNRKGTARVHLDVLFWSAPRD
jgi:hypothetical protein